MRETDDKKKISQQQKWKWTLNSTFAFKWVTGEDLMNHQRSCWALAGRTRCTGREGQRRSFFVQNQAQFKKKRTENAAILTPGHVWRCEFPLQTGRRSRPGARGVHRRSCSLTWVVEPLPPEHEASNLRPWRRRSLTFCSQSWSVVEFSFQAQLLTGWLHTESDSRHHSMKAANICLLSASSYLPATVCFPSARVDDFFTVWWVFH